MDRSELFASNRSSFIDRFSNDVHDSSKSFGAHGHFDRIAGVENRLSSYEALSRIQGNRSHVAATEMLRHFEDKSVLSSLDLEGIENRRKSSVKLNVDDGTDNLGYFSRQRSSRTE